MQLLKLYRRTANIQKESRFIMFATIMTIINISSLILIAVVYFREHYTIVSIEEWNELAHYYNEHVKAEEEASQEAAGGCGFFWDYISPLEQEYEEEPDDE